MFSIFNIIRNRRVYFIISLLLIIPGLVAMIYNTAHSYMVPMALMTTGFMTAEPLILSIAMIWLAHIGFDRALGYGLKYAAGFRFTHLGRIGKRSAGS